MIKIAVAGTRGFPGVQGGVENHCERLYTRLAENGCDITVFTRKPYVVSDVDTFKGVKLVPLSCPQNKFLEAIVHTFKSVIMAKKLNPDILHIHAVGPSLFVPLARLLGMKVIVTSHGPDYKRKKWPLPAKMFLRFCEWMGMTFANKIITIAKNIADDIKNKYNRDSSIIPNGVEIPLLAETKNSLERFQLINQKYILSVGRFVAEKGFDDLIDAFNQGDFENWKLVIVGDADHDDKYSHYLKSKANKNSNIVLTGFLTGLPLHELYTHAGLFVLPSYYEGLPIVLLEAMSYGLSCIASDIPANRNVELHEERFFKVGDVNALSVRIREFIDKPWEVEDRRDQLDIVAEKYDWEKIANETMKVYRGIVS
jgi:glycosyltransferase involved in cell wall biosynthesis